MFESYKHVHFVGIGGIGMSALAKWFLHEGVKVSGSDVHLSSVTHDLETRGATIFSGHSDSNLAQRVDLLIYSPAVPSTNVERAVSIERGIPSRTNFEVLGELSKSFSTIVVSGTNGKSTTTAMLGLMLEAAGYDPTVLVGALVPGFKDGNFRHGRGKFFVVEGCEYRANMLNFHPGMVVLTNIEEDHLDYYRDLKHIQESFQTFVDKVKGAVVVNLDDVGSSALQVSRPVTYGFNRPARQSSCQPTCPPKPWQRWKPRRRLVGDGGTNPTYAFISRKTENGIQQISTNVGNFELQVPGEFNVYNALAATAAAMELGVPFETCRQVLKDFRGIWRRFERVGVWKGADVISDYGHHPSAIKQTLEAAREFFPGRRIVLCYQPHQHDRTKKLFQEFVDVLALADVTVVAEIYDVAGRNEEHGISSRDLVKETNRSNTTYSPDLAATESQLRELVKPNDVLLIMGAGDIDDLARALV